MIDLNIRVPANPEDNDEFMDGIYLLKSAMLSQYPDCEVRVRVTKVSKIRQIEED